MARLCGARGSVVLEDVEARFVVVEEVEGSKKSGCGVRGVRGAFDPVEAFAWVFHSNKTQVRNEGQTGRIMIALVYKRE